MADSYIVGSLETAGTTASDAEKRKITHYADLTEGRFIFSPVAFETFGPWGPATRELISTIGRKITERTGERRASEYLRQRISIEIQRGNAASVFGTHSNTRELDEIFYVLNTKR